jgi:hypothetical protein
MEARRRKARALWLRFSQSFARRRQRPSQPMVRSTIHRLCATTIGTADDFGDEARHDARQAVMKYGSRIGAVGEQLLEERELSEHCGQQRQPAVAILNIGGGDQRVQQQTQRIDEDVALLAFDQLAGVEPMRIDAGPPFSALFTLWLSTMQAVGLASRSSCSRHLT